MNIAVSPMFVYPPVGDGKNKSVKAVSTVAIVDRDAAAASFTLVSLLMGSAQPSFIKIADSATNMITAEVRSMSSSR